MLHRWFAPVLLLLASASVTRLSLSELEDEITIPATEKGLALSELIGIVQRNLGFTIFFDPKEVEFAEVSFSSDIKVTRDHLLEVFEQLLDHAGFLVLERGTPENRLYTIHQAGAPSGRGAKFKSAAALKSADEVVALGHRSVLVTTTIQLKQLSAREMVQVLMDFFSDPFVENIRNIEGTNLVVLSGKAKTVSRVIQMARELDSRVDGATPFEFTKVYERLQALETEVAGLKSDQRPN